jgi:hypothetical protein
MNAYCRSMTKQLCNVSVLLMLCLTCTATGQPTRAPYTDTWQSKIAQIGVLANQDEMQEARVLADSLVDDLIKSADTDPLLLRYTIPLEAILTEIDHEPGLARLARVVAEHFESIPLDNLKGESLVGMAGLMKRAGRDDQVNTMVERAQVRIRHAETNQRVLSLPLLDSLGRLAQLSGSEELHDLVANQRALIDPTDPTTRLSLAPLEFTYLAKQYQKSGDTDALDELAWFIVQDYLPHTGVSASILPSEWLDLGRIVASSRDKAARIVMADLLVDAVRRGRVPINRQGGGGLRALAASVEELRGSQDDAFRELLASKWFGFRAGWEVLPQDTKQSLVAIIMGDHKAFTSLTSALAKQHEQGDLDQLGYIVMIRASARLDQREEAGDWGLKLVESKWLTPTAYGDNANRIGATLLAVARSGVSLSEPQSQKMIALIQSLDLVSTQIPDQAYAAVAAMLLRSDSIDDLESVQSHEDGTLNMAIVKTLVWAYAGQGEARQYARELIDSIDAEVGDKTAVYWLAITYAVSVHHDDLPRTAGMTEYLSTALKAAETDPTRIRVLEELAAMALANGYTNYALGIIEGERPQFAEVDRARLTVWTNRLKHLSEVKSSRKAVRQEARAFVSGFNRKRRAY